MKKEDFHFMALSYIIIFSKKFQWTRKSSNDHLVVVIETKRWLIPGGENGKITAHRNMTGENIWILQDTIFFLKVSERVLSRESPFILVPHGKIWNFQVSALLPLLTI